jgi:hypothetical protein
MGLSVSGFGGWATEGGADVLQPLITLLPASVVADGSQALRQMLVRVFVVSQLAGTDDPQQ